MPPETPENPTASPSKPFDFYSDPIAPVRMSQAAFARWLQVSKQTVSTWVKKEWITTFTDGTVDPVRAIQELDRNKGLHKIRAGIFQLFSKEAYALRMETAARGTRIQWMTGEAIEANKRIHNLEAGLSECLAAALDLGTSLEVFRQAVEGLRAETRGLSDDAWRVAIDELFDQVMDESIDQVATDPESAMKALDLAQFAELLAAKYSPQPFPGEGGQSDD